MASARLQGYNGSHSPLGLRTSWQGFCPSDLQSGSSVAGDSAWKSGRVSWALSEIPPSKTTSPQHLPTMKRPALVQDVIAGDPILPFSIQKISDGPLGNVKDSATENRCLKKKTKNLPSAWSLMLFSVTQPLLTELHARPMLGSGMRE